MKLDLRKKLKNNEFTVVIYDKLKRFYYQYLISDEKIIKKKFKERVGRDVELINPVKFNDKLQWLKLYWRDPIATKCADKYKVREFIKEKIGSQYLNELIAVYESVDEIDLEKLPNKFVLKGTHGSGFNIICTDKSKMNWVQQFKKMRRWLRTNYYLQNREWPYKDIKPRIICEKYLSKKDGYPPEDYKVFCFDGLPKYIAVDFAKYGDYKDNINKLNRNIYDTAWNFKNYQCSVPNNSNISFDKPVILEELLDLSKKLSYGFPHVRVDFYVLDRKIYFGELTFFNTSGMGKITPEEFELEMGSYIKIPND